VREAVARHSPRASAAYQARNGPGAEVGGLRAGAVLFRALSGRRIHTIGEIKAGPDYFVLTRNSGGVIPSTHKLSGI
jgi:hypothetical protein